MSMFKLCTNRLSRTYGRLFQQSTSRCLSTTSNPQIAADFQVTSQTVEESDNELWNLILSERIRQKETINLSPLENYASRSTLDTIQTVLQNKYSEGYPHARYYGGNENVDEAEELCQKRALDLFNLSYDEWGVNVQSLSGGPAHLSSFTALISPKSRVMTLSSKCGGDISLGGSNESSLQTFFNVLPYRTDKNTNLIDYTKLEEIAYLYKPDIIISGSGIGSGYVRPWDWAHFDNIAKMSKNTIHLSDISDIGGLIATGLYPSPFQFCDIVTCSTNSSLRGPKGAAIIFYRKKYAHQVDMAVFPGHQGGPHNHAISALATSLLQASSDEFKHYQERALDNAHHLSNELINKGYDIATNGTNTTTVIAKQKSMQAIEPNDCDSANIHVLFDNDSQTVRLSTLAMTTRGLDHEHFTTIADFIQRASSNGKTESVKKEVTEFAKQFPLPGVDVVE